MWDISLLSLNRTSCQALHYELAGKSKDHQYRKSLKASRFWRTYFRSLMAELDDLLARMEATDNSADNSELDARFHEAICSAGGNSTWTGLMSLFRSRGRHFNVFDSIEGATAGHIAQTEFWLRKLRPEPNVDH